MFAPKDNTDSLLRLTGRTIFNIFNNTRHQAGPVRPQKTNNGYFITLIKCSQLLPHVFYQNTTWDHNFGVFSLQYNVNSFSMENCNTEPIFNTELAL